MRYIFSTLVILVFIGCGSTHKRLSHSLVNYHNQDLNLFRNTFKKIDLSNHEQCKKIIENEYYAKGSEGLKSFVKLRLEKGQHLCQVMKAVPEFYKSVASSKYDTNSSFALVSKSFRKLKKIYPKTTPVEVYFLIGKTTTAGTVDKNKLLMGLEMYGPSLPGVSFEKSPKHLKKLNLNVDNIAYLIVHELIHSQQNIQGEPKTLLENSVIEGAADFLTYHLTGKVPDTVDYGYGYKNEESFKKKFQKVMTGKKLSDFLYNMSESPHPDMGYFIGFRIVESYFKKQSDKKAAIANILNISNYSKFTKESGYFTGE